MKFNHRFNNHVHAFLELNKTERLWHFPLSAGLCVGLCLLVGWYFDRPAYGNLSSIGALVILYFTQASLAKGWFIFAFVHLDSVLHLRWDMFSVLIRY